MPKPLAPTTEVSKKDWPEGESDIPERKPDADAAMDGPKEQSGPQEQSDDEPSTTVMRTAPGAADVEVDRPLKAKKRGRVTFSENSDGEEGSRADAAADNDGQDEPWSEALHRNFVGAVLEVGLQHASPAVIMQGMRHVPPDVTSERVKSHLQKYRKNKDKNKEDFLDEYDAWMRHATRVASLPDPASAPFVPPGAARATSRQPPRLHAGDRAAALSWSVLNEGKAAASASAAASMSFPTGTTFKPSAAHVSTKNQQSFTFALPTVEELATPLGSSIAQLLAVFPPMVQSLVEEREAKRETVASNSRSPDATASHLGPIGTVVSTAPSSPGNARRQLELTPIRALADSSVPLAKDDTSPSSPPRKGS